MSYTAPNHYKSQPNLVGYRIAQRLNDAAQDLPHDITQRLKAARMLALDQRQVARRQSASAVSVQGGSAVLHLGGDESSLWNRLASVLPLIALIAGLITIGVLQEQSRAQELADVDTELLTDDLPPAAYTDPGFLKFLSAKSQE
ncbi:MAG: DUF3619 family protein [Burkholderiales bacterium]|nr:DUF3619 family protein [Burkholderiales bacterium]